MEDHELPCGHTITDEELKALWGRRNGRITSEAKKRSSIENAKKGGQANRARWAKIREEKNG